jgi:hypothetical protein
MGGSWMQTLLEFGRAAPIAAGDAILPKRKAIRRQMAAAPAAEIVASTGDPALQLALRLPCHGHQPAAPDRQRPKLSAVMRSRPARIASTATVSFTREMRTVAVGEIEDASARRGRRQFRGPAQRKNCAQARQQLRQMRIVGPAFEMKGFEAFGQLRISQKRLPGEIGSGADQRILRSLARNRMTLRKIRWCSSYVPIASIRLRFLRQPK